MKKVFQVSALLLAMTGCVKNEGPREVKGLKIPIQTVKRISVSGYKGQLPYINGADMQALTRYNAEHNWEEKISDTLVDWEDLDREYRNTLPREVRQQFAFDILVAKDLIGLAKAAPEGKVYQEKIKKYVTVLTAEHYVDFCVLYEAISAVEDTDYRRDSAATIISYSATDVFHLQALNNPDLANSAYKIKIEENYGYLEKIRTMAE
ncbi:MAG: hypothetical protein PSV16_12740 [Flavobacterium sp.]|nr:hypothetical protein [Flavobacterium sp.]